MSTCYGLGEDTMHNFLMGEDVMYSCLVRGVRG